MSVRDEFTVDSHGLVTDLGKFEREPIYVPHFWQQGLEGCSDEDYGDVQGFTLIAEDFTEFPELAKDGWEVGQTLWLWERSDGFVVIADDDVVENAKASEGE